MLFRSGPMVVPFLAAFPIAYASWKWIESPYRRQTNWRGWRLFFAAGLAILVPITMSLVIWQQKGFPRRLSTARTQPPSSRESMTTSYDTSPIDFKIDELPLLGDRNVEPSFLVWGDSHALALAPILNEVASQYGKSGRLVARGGTPPLIAAWRGDSVAAGADSGLRWSANALEAMGARQWEAIVVIAGWQIYVHETGLRDASSGTSSSETSAGVLKRQLQRTAAAMPTTSKVFWLQPAPRQSTDLARALGNRALNKWAPEVGKGIDREEYDQQVSEIREAFQSLTQLPGHNWVDVTSNFFTEQGRARLFDGTEFCYLDDNHVSQAGARLYFGDAIREIMETIGGEIGRAHV